MSFIFKWLRPERPSGVALHPVRIVELAEPLEAAYARCAEGIERVLGGVIRETDERHTRIDATFGLVNSERITVTLEPMDGAHTRVTIESRRVLSAEPARTSQYVGELAKFLAPESKLGG